MAPRRGKDSRFQIPDSRFQIPNAGFINIILEFGIWNLEYGIRNA
jgi:hypothetical protein